MKPRDLSKPQSNTPRIQPLAVLPVFFDLHGKKAFVVGASEGALWKAELLLQAGANVTLVCETPSRQILQLLSDNLGSPLTLDMRHWQEVAFDGVAMVVADIQDQEAEELCIKARVAGAVVNVVDKPEFCQFQFGSIVNKSPLVIGVSTGGAAPVLAQMVRSLIETALPESAQKLAISAQKIRQRVNARLVSPYLRRKYWNSYFARVFGKSKTPMILNDAYVIEKCKVDDLTMLDLRMLRNAEEIFVAPNSNCDIVNLGRREARRKLVSSTIDTTALPYGAVVILPKSPQGE